MALLVKILIGIVAFEHLFIMYFEMFAWDTLGKKIFKTLPRDLFSSTKVMAGNQGLYNGFLAAGLIWSLLVSDELWAHNLASFFLSCVIVAGVYGAATTDKKIFFTQTLPALLALALVPFL
ncbi:DUF1304 domain-containing protein [Riemerella columbipharyngis]|uniref:Putative membrane protein n=1 Tax=Riemerella columbipharyngis TaxID=1071918 RepID=A0A1G7AXX6_9FLAO|nr:DUF1304 domain-containing protein [Riemerella columbipharyngis]SDE19562.1 putative membrane protein [Riemerella columbipharyngis]